MRNRFGRVSIVVGGMLLLLACGRPAPGKAEGGGPPLAAGIGGASWAGWGGPTGDFKIPTRGLSAAWPEDGPPVLWSRTLGAGYSAIAADRGRLYTMYRDGDEDVVVALNAATGETLWEHRYEARALEGQQVQFGRGPNATPLVLPDRIVTLGYTGRLKCLDRNGGAELWSHELVSNLGGEALVFGYSASPVLHDGNVIVLIGGDRYGVAAFDPADGEIVWSGPPTSVSYATPSVIDVDGQRQLVYFSADEIIAIEPGAGTRLWSFPVRNQYDNNATGALWGDDNLLWVATQLDGGTRVLELRLDGESTRVEEIWSSNQMSIHFWNALRLDGAIYASVGSNASVLAAIDVKTGEFLWRERGFEQVNFVHAGERTILFDANGQLAIAELSPDGLDVAARADVIEGPAWTVPTLVGTTLYIRTQETMLALDLG